MQVRFTVGPIYTKYHIYDANVKEIASLTGVIRMVCQARPEGFQYMPKFRQGVWDGYINLCRSDTFPTGLLNPVIRALPLGTGVDIVDQLDYPLYDGSALTYGMFRDLELRPYQVTAATDLLQAKRGIAQMATNSGKTEVIAAMCRALSCDIVVVTTKVDLLHQTAKRLESRLGEAVGKLGDGRSTLQRVTVATVQSMSNDNHADALQHLSTDVKCIMFDECHHVPSKTAQQVLMTIPAPMRFGFSGTPLHHDDLLDLTLIGATGEIIIEVSNEQLIQMGVSAKPIVDMLTIEQYTPDKLEYADAYEKWVVQNTARNQLIQQQASQAAGVVLILVERLEHGRALQASLPQSVFLHGGLSGDVRAQQLQKMRDGLLKIVIATPIFDEGVDVPSIDTLILAGGGVSAIKLLQRLGRGMRHKPGSNVLHVIDFVDDTNEYLLSHSEMRARTYEAEGFEVKVSTPTH